VDEDGPHKDIDPHHLVLEIDVASDLREKLNGEATHVPGEMLLGWHNLHVAGEEVEATTSLSLPYSGLLEVDYVDFHRKKMGMQRDGTFLEPIDPEELHNILVQEDATVSGVALSTVAGDDPAQQTSTGATGVDITTLRILSSELVLTTEQVRDVVINFREGWQREEAAVMLWPRVVDWHTASYTVVMDVLPYVNQVNLAHRLGLPVPAAPDEDPVEEWKSGALHEVAAAAAAAAAAEFEAAQMQFDEGAPSHSPRQDDSSVTGSVTSDAPDVWSAL